MIPTVEKELNQLMDFQNIVKKFLYGLILVMLLLMEEKIVREMHSVNLLFVKIRNVKFLILLRVMLVVIIININLGIAKREVI